MNKKLKITALHYLTKYDFSIFPVNSKTKRPIIDSWTPYQTDKPSVDQVKSWWDEWPDAAIGIATGPVSGLLVLDVDSEKGWKYVTEEKRLGSEPTPIAKTGGGGYHVYYNYPNGNNITIGARIGNEDHKLDFRGKGGYVIAPPSGHPSGNRYKWKQLLKKHSPVDPPGWLMEELKNKGNGHGDVDSLLKGVTEGNRNESAAKVAGRYLARFDKENWNLAWNAMEAWNQKNKPPLRPDELRRTFKSIAKRENKKGNGANKTSTPPPVDKDTPPPKVKEKSDNEKREYWEPEITSLGDVEAENIRWLWEPYIPKGKITILEGHPGVGKTFIALMLAARISQGEQFLKPGVDKTGHPDQMLYMTAEDGLGDTLKPRLEAMGANANNVHSLRFIIDKETGNKRFVSFHEDIEYISKAIKQVDPALIVADPLQGFLGSGVNAHRANEVRPVLAGLSDIAEEHNTAILLIRHLTKSSRPNSISRGLGSIDFAAHARSILMAGKNPDIDGEFVITQNKGNLAEPGPSLGYRLKDNKLVWTGESYIESSDIVAPEATREEKSAQEEAEDFLKKILKDGPKPTKKIFGESKSLGIAKKTLRRAKKSLGVESNRNTDGWLWIFDETGEGSQDGQIP